MWFSYRCIHTADKLWKNRSKKKTPLNPGSRRWVQDLSTSCPKPFLKSPGFKPSGMPCTSTVMSRQVCIWVAIALFQISKSEFCISYTNSTLVKAYICLSLKVCAQLCYPKGMVEGDTRNCPHNLFCENGWLISNGNKGQTLRSGHSANQKAFWCRRFRSVQLILAPFVQEKSAKIVELSFLFIGLRSFIWVVSFHEQTSA